MTRRQTVLLVLVGALALAGAVTALFRSADASSSPKTALARVSSVGRPVALHGVPPRVLRFMGVQQGFLLALRGRLAFYLLRTGDGNCFSVGPSSEVGKIGGPVCPQGFPSGSRPVLDLSIYESTSHDRSVPLSLFRIEGFAADGVAAIAFVRPDASVAIPVPVRENVFSGRSPSGPVAGLVAYDAAGKEVWRSP